MTARETFEHYGTLYNTDKANIKNKTNELDDIHNFPNLNSNIDELR